MIVTDRNVQDALCKTCGTSFVPQRKTLGMFCSNQCSGVAKRIPIEEKLLQHSIPEPNSGCWLWTGNLSRLGYGLVRDGKMRSAHRVSYECFRGPIPDGMDLLHSCDIRSCINPDHLRPGTHIENMRDMVIRGRSWSRLNDRV